MKNSVITAPTNMNASSTSATEGLEMSRQDESLAQLPQSADYRHTIDMLQAKVWLYQATTVLFLIATACLGFSK